MIVGRGENEHGEACDVEVHDELRPHGEQREERHDPQVVLR
jgi:hypothetical protein